MIKPDFTELGFIKRSNSVKSVICLYKQFLKEAKHEKKI